MKKHIILTWTARISGLLIIAFFMLFFIGEGIPDIVEGRGKELLQFLPFMLPVFMGFILSWRRPVAGGWILIAGAVIIAAYLLFSNDIRAAIIYGVPFLLMGLCFLAAGERSLI
jgi:hypothetical protein